MVCIAYLTCEHKEVFSLQGANANCQNFKGAATNLGSSLVRYLNASFKIDVDIPDKSAIFFPHTSHDLYFTFLVGTTSADFNMAAISAFQYEILHLFANISSSESLKPLLFCYTRACMHLRF